MHDAACAQGGGGNTEVVLPAPGGAREGRACMRARADLANAQRDDGGGPPELAVGLLVGLRGLQDVAVDGRKHALDRAKHLVARALPARAKHRRLPGRAAKKGFQGQGAHVCDRTWLKSRRLPV